MPMQRFRPFFLTAASLFTGLAGPSLLLGRASVGVALGLSLICVICSGDHKQTWTVLRREITKPLTLILGIIALGTAINIPFSIDIKMSFEAWIRSWALLGATFYIVFHLRNQIPLILKTLAVSLFACFLLMVSGVLPFTKLIMNGFLLALPTLSLLLAFEDKKPRYALIGLGVLLVFYILCTLLVSAKASLAGLILILLIGVLFWGISRFSLVKATFITVPLLAAIAIFLAFWLPEQLNNSSTLNADAAPFPIWLVDFHRQLIWAFSFDLFSLSPWVGFGLNAGNFHPLAGGNVTEYFGAAYTNMNGLATAPIYPAHAHNWIMEMLVDGGIFATIPMIFAVAALFTKAISRYFSAPHGATLAFIMVNAAYWGTGLMNFSFWSTWWQALYFLNAAICLAAILTRNENSPEA